MAKKIFYRKQKSRLDFPDKVFNGFGYHCYSTHQDTRYIRCYQRSSLACPAQGQIKNGQAQLKKVHNHKSDPKLELYVAFQDELYNATVTRPYRSLRVIYDYYCPKHYEASRKYTWAKMQSVMNIWKRRDRLAYPPIPHNLQEYENFLGMPQYAHLTSYPQGRLRASTLEVCDGSFLTALYDLNFVASIPTTTTFFMDATFQCTPKQPKIYQFFTILMLINHKALPVYWMLMTRKTAAAYKMGLEFFKAEVAPHIVPNTIMEDFESGLKAAIRATYPQADHKGCFFHFCQALIKKLKQLRLFETVKTCKYIQIIIRKFMGLVLLPANDIRRGYDWLVDAIPDEMKVILQPFIVYFYDEWIVRTQPALWSVFNEGNRTNNNTESYNKKANDRFGVHPTIWTFTEKLTNLQAVTRIEFDSLNDGEMITRERQTPEEVYHESKIKKMCDLYRSGILDVSNFLACASEVSHAFRLRNFVIIPNNAEDNNYRNLQIFLELDVFDFDNED